MQQESAESPSFSQSNGGNQFTSNPSGLLDVNKAQSHSKFKDISEITDYSPINDQRSLDLSLGRDMNDFLYSGPPQVNIEKANDVKHSKTGSNKILDTPQFQQKMGLTTTAFSSKYSSNETKNLSTSKKLPGTVRTHQDKLETFLKTQFKKKFSTHFNADLIK